MNTNESAELVQDQSTNNLHLRGADREDGTATALCNRRYRVVTYSAAAQESLRVEWTTWHSCQRCVTKAAKH